MERNFKGPKVGDEYRINKLYDRGGYPAIRVLAVNPGEHRITVQDMHLDGTLGPLNPEPRPLHDGPGWPKLRKCWRRHKRTTDIKGIPR